MAKSTINTMEELLALSRPQNIQKGQSVEGVVVALSDSEAVVDLEAKSEGVLNKKEIEGKELKVGDKISAFVSATDFESGQLILTFDKQNIKFKSPSPRGKVDVLWNKFIQSQKDRNTLGGKVVEVNKGGLVVEVDGVRGFLPSSQIGKEILDQLADKELIGLDAVVTVIEVDSSSNRLIFSQKGINKQPREVSGVEIGQKVKCKVTAVSPFGIFCKLEQGGSLIPLNEISWDRVEDLQAFKVGQEIEAVVLSIDSGKIDLSIKQLDKDPFEEIIGKYQPDDVVKGVVSEVSPQGVKVKLEDGLEGVIDSEKLDASDYEVGQTVTVLIDSVDKYKRKISLAPMLTTTKGLIYK